MFEALGRVMYRHRRSVLVVAVLFTAFAGVWGTRVFADLANGGFTEPHSESQRATDLAAATLSRTDADVVVVYRDESRTVDDPAFEQAVTGRLATLPTDKVAGVTTYWPDRPPALASTDRHATYAAIRLAGGSDDARLADYRAIKGELAVPGLRTTYGGFVGLSDEVNAQVKKDLTKAESLSTPILLVLLVLIFGSAAAASLPLVVGGLTILGSFTALRVLSLFTEVSVYAINVITLLGLGLAIDYGLFMVSRFREELAGGREVPDAIARTMATAGRTIAVSAVTVAVSLSSLLLFPQVFLRSMGLGGMAAVLLAMVLALSVLPALLAVLGHRVDALSVRRLLPGRPRGRGRGDADGETGVWARLARGVMRRPVTVAVSVLALLVLLGLPFSRISFGWVDARVLPAGAQARQAQEIIARDFPGNAANPIEAVVSLPEPATGPSGQAALAAYLSDVQAVPGVTDAALTGAAEHTARVTVHFAGEPISGPARDLVDRIRAVPAPAGGEVLVGGTSAQFADLLDGLGARLPWMALFVAVTTFVLLFLAFGSVVLPVKAILMNVLSLSAMFGVLVWIFQEGHLSGLLGFDSTGNIEATQPILMLAIAFGLSMDYEVFLLSRIREQYDLTGDNSRAVASGLQRTGAIITSAALLLIVVTGSFAVSGVLFIKLIGVGLAIAIAVDATIVRVLLVPATMRLLGRANWWAPGPLRRAYARYGIHEREAEPARAAAAQAGAAGADPASVGEEVAHAGPGLAGQHGSRPGP
ncbi:MAG TPA: MMPL family transporter [Mycobacteriales bacterium]|nr:MMPL family transporter [Mycobacteriales bacterium]